MSDYLSYTQINMYLRCGEQYRRRYINNEILPPSVAMVKGGAIHKGIEHNHRHKIQYGIEAPKKDVVEVSMDRLDKDIGERGLSDQIDDPNKLNKEIIDICGYYVESISPGYRPKYIEESFEFPITPRAKKKVLAIIDCIDDNYNIIDYKITSKKISKLHQSNLQLMIYYAAMSYNLHRVPSGMVYNNILATSKGISHEAIDFSVGHFDKGHDAVEKIIDEVNKGIQAGIYLPANSGNWYCSDKFCGFFKTCRYRGT